MNYELRKGKTHAAVSYTHLNHLLQGIIRQLHHEMDMLVLLLGEILIGLALNIYPRRLTRDSDLQILNSGQSYRR